MSLLGRLTMDRQWQAQVARRLLAIFYRPSSANRALFALLVAAYLTLVCQGHTFEDKHSGPHLALLGEFDPVHIAAVIETTDTPADGGHMARTAQDAGPVEEVAEAVEAPPAGPYPAPPEVAHDPGMSQLTMAAVALLALWLWWRRTGVSPEPDGRLATLPSQAVPGPEPPPPRILLSLA